MAEWLGTGLQNQVQQFDSAWYLKTKGLTIVSPFCFEYRFATAMMRPLRRQLNYLMERSS